MFFRKQVRTIAFIVPCVLLVLFGVGCSLPRQEPDAHDHGSVEDAHDHEEEHEEHGGSVSLYTDDIELFAEFPLLVAGEPKNFLLHLTHVRTGLPVRETPVTFKAAPAQGGEGIAGTAHPARTGIYIIEPVFPSGGEWTLTLEIPVADGTATVVIDDLDVHGENDVHDHDHGEENTSPNVVRFTKEQQWVVPVVTVPADVGVIVERRRLPASVLSTPHTRNVASAAVTGITTARDGAAFPNVGDAVVAGQVLALLTTEAMTAESLARDANLQGMVSLRTDLNARAIEASGNAARARALVAQHDTALTRAEALLAAGAGSQREADALRGTRDEARATLVAAERAAAQAQRTLEETSPAADAGAPGVIEVVAPISGNITRVFAGPGTRVTGGEPIVEIVNAAQVLIEARAPESLAASVEAAPSGMIEVPGRPGELHEIIPAPDAPEPWMLPYVDDATRTVPVVFHAANPDSLFRVGMSLTLWLDVRRVEDAVRIPNSAVVDENGILTAYVMLSGEAFQKRNVRLGVSDGVLVEVLDGVRAGERVASQGAYAVRLAGLADSGLGSAHVH